MKIKPRQVTVYELHLECKCGRKDVFRICGAESEEDARDRIPTHMWNGWELKKERCPLCHRERERELTHARSK